MAQAAVNLLTKAFETEFLKDYGLGGVLYGNIMTKKLTGKKRGESVTFPGVGAITSVLNRAPSTPLAPNFPDGVNATVNLDIAREYRVDFRDIEKSQTYLDVVGEHSKAMKDQRDEDVDIDIAQRVAQSSRITKSLAAEVIDTPEKAYNYAGELIGLVLADLPKSKNVQTFLEVDFDFERLLKEYYRKNITSNTALFEKDGELWHDSFKICRTPAIFSNADGRHIFAHTKDAIGFVSSLANVKTGYSDTYNSNYVVGTDVHGADVLVSKYVSLGVYKPQLI